MYDFIISIICFFWLLQCNSFVSFERHPVEGFKQCDIHISQKRNAQHRLHSSCVIVAEFNNRNAVSLLIISSFLLFILPIIKALFSTIFSQGYMLPSTVTKNRLTPGIHCPFGCQCFGTMLVSSICF